MRWREVVAGVPGMTTSLSDELGVGLSDAWIGSRTDVWALANDRETHPQVMHFDGTWHVSIPDSGHSLVTIWAFADGTAVAAGYDAVFLRTP